MSFLSFINRIINYILIHVFCFCHKTNFLCFIHAILFIGIFDEKQSIVYIFTTVFIEKTGIKLFPSWQEYEQTDLKIDYMYAYIYVLIDFLSKSKRGTVESYSDYTFTCGMHYEDVVFKLATSFIFIPTSNKGEYVLFVADMIFNLSHSNGCILTFNCHCNLHLICHLTCI